MNVKKTELDWKRKWRFVTSEIWDVEITSLQGLKRFGVQILRVLNLVVRGFRKDECPLHAAALTFSTLMSLVPVLALSLALARGLGDAETAKNHIREAVSQWTQQFEEADMERASFPDGTNGFTMVQANGLDGTNGLAVAGMSPGRSELAVQIDELVEEILAKVENISFTALGGVGLALLLWMVIQVLGQVEHSFNRVWGVTQGRTLLRKFTDYLSVLIILPFLTVAASSVPVVDFATRYLDAQQAQVLRAFLDSPLLNNTMVLLFATLCFAFVLVFIPHTRVKAGPALLGGLVTALLFIVWLWVCAKLQMRAAQYGRIYGSFAVVPILLAWVYVSWEIVLFGAEIAFAVQNCTTYQLDEGARNASVTAKLVLGLEILREAAGSMVSASRPFMSAQYAREHRIPVRFLNEVVGALVEIGLLGRLSDREDTYVLLRAPESLTVRAALRSMLDAGAGPAELSVRPEDPQLQQVVERMTQPAEEKSLSATFLDLAASKTSARRGKEPS